MKNIIGNLKDKLNKKGISDPAACTKNSISAVADDVLDQVSGGFGQVIGFTRGHTQGGTFTQWSMPK